MSSSLTIVNDDGNNPLHIALMCILESKTLDEKRNAELVLQEILTAILTLRLVFVDKIATTQNKLGKTCFNLFEAIKTFSNEKVKQELSFLIEVIKFSRESWLKECRPEEQNAQKLAMEAEINEGVMLAEQCCLQDENTKNSKIHSLLLNFIESPDSKVENELRQCFAALTMIPVRRVFLLINMKNNNNQTIFDLLNQLPSSHSSMKQDWIDVWKFFLDIQKQS